MRLEFEALTPIWLGGDKGREPGPPKESGIVGSLRFWYEGLLRGRGEWVCPDRGESCSKEKDETAVECGVCKLFGNTTHARTFQLSVRGLAPAPKGRHLERLVGGQGFRWAFWPRSHGFSLDIHPRMSAPADVENTVRALA